MLLGCKKITIYIYYINKTYIYIYLQRIYIKHIYNNYVKMNLPKGQTSVKCTRHARFFFVNLFKVFVQVGMSIYAVSSPHPKR